MSETKHSPEPWQVGVNDGYEEVWDARGGMCADPWSGSAPEPMADPDGWYFQTRLANARRIVAAVNAVAGIPTEVLERGILAGAIVVLERVAELSSDNVAAVEAASALQRLGRLP